MTIIRNNHKTIVRKHCQSHLLNVLLDVAP